MSTERELAEKFKEAIETKNIDGICPYLAEDMVYEALPSTVGKKMGKVEWREQMTDMLAAVQSVKANLALVFPSGPFTQEILLLFNFSKDESGALKITSVTEYMDSFKVKELKAKMASGPPPSK
ncbi:hypothetical protein BDM02DRAFT_3131918 [Thelephora ganbajun]|uniref:Uncharacterized protein n=1 Tax=Thelephora ganbajun TaxID=370292 RepID=A0ACB6Z3W4_THEGA|nr:hypothetical protein BDM02DRAFT_3131918 [Thelephora ganbajun]